MIMRHALSTTLVLLLAGALLGADYRLLHLVLAIPIYGTALVIPVLLVWSEATLEEDAPEHGWGALGPLVVGILAERVVVTDREAVENRLYGGRVQDNARDAIPRGDAWLVAGAGQLGSRTS